MRMKLDRRRCWEISVSRQSKCRAASRLSVTWCAGGRCPDHRALVVRLGCCPQPRRYSELHAVLLYTRRVCHVVQAIVARDVWRVAGWMRWTRYWAASAAAAAAALSSHNDDACRAAWLSPASRLKELKPFMTTRLLRLGSRIGAARLYARNKCRRRLYYIVQRRFCCTIDRRFMTYISVFYGCLL